MKIAKSTAHPNNFCGNAFPDWLEVNLTPECNGSCAWCVERQGWHPDYRAPWDEIADAAIATGRQNIILLGGEPTLHPDFAKVVSRIADAGLRPWVTTNGSKLTPEWVDKNMVGIFGVNVSIHHYNLGDNHDITGIKLGEGVLAAALDRLLDMGAVIRFNCNVIRGAIDTVGAIRRYILWAHSMRAHKVRFAELKYANGDFVDLADILDHKYGLNDNPFEDGCNSDAVIDGMPVNFRQMCGMQTRLRPCPDNPEVIPHPVLYYDGRFYDGWQQPKESDMKPSELLYLLEQVHDKDVTVAEAAILIDRAERGEQEQIKRKEPEGGGSCVY